MAAWWPFHLGALVEDGALSEKELWKRIGYANNKDSPPPYLVKGIALQIGRERANEAHARTLLARYGIEWTDEMNGNVIPTPMTRSPESRTATREQERLRTMHYEARSEARRKHQTAEDADRVYLARAAEDGIPEAAARAAAGI
jgi:hypothetical protein